MVDMHNTFVEWMNTHEVVEMPWWDLSCIFPLPTGLVTEVLGKVMLEYKNKVILCGQRMKQEVKKLSYWPKMLKNLFGQIHSTSSTSNV